MPSKPSAQTPPRRLPFKVTWDGAILSAAIVWGSAEILFLGARPSSLTFISGMVVSAGVGRLERKGRD